jgi:hypothetical protein
MENQPTETPEAAAWPHIAPLLDEALARLNETDRRAVLLRHFEGRTLAETGAALALTEDAARKRVARALDKLRKFLSKRGVTLTATVLAGAVAANSVQAAPAALAKTISAVALAKGAAAGTSTLILVKGTLKTMAWTKAKTTVITTVAVLLVGGTATLAVKLIREQESRKHEAEFNGKSVDYWVHTALWGLNQANTVETYGALRHIGAPAAVMLVQALTQTNSPTENPSFSASAVRQNAFAALEQMGPAAKNQIPELIGLLKHDDKDVRIWATLVLAGIGPAAKDAIPALMDESQDANYADYAKEALRQIKR